MRLLTITLALWCSLPVFAQDAAPLPVATADASAFSAKLDELWKTRDAADAVKQNDDVIRDGLKAFPSDYDLLWRAARIRWWVADGLTEEKLKKQVAKEGWNYAKRAAEAKPAGSEAKYFTALNIGAYSQAVGILKALSDGLEGQFVDNLEFSLKNNESFDRYGGRTAKGRYYWELPWPKRDLGKSKAELQKSIDKNPEHLRNYYFLADTLLKDGDKKGAKDAIDKVLNGSDAYDPPEARRVKAWAKAFVEKELK
ncbi:MAG: hypothetical protein Q8N23_08035 [Archangium sp.]|nr:hypothetical protein [Archangium sp.]MDP3152602.1 hypothetical protein [Archangium sp.]MDP3571022.1 hypothetical protein [Archangium sp.]